MKLDFVMKLFLSLIVVFFVIIAVYYTANGLAKMFGINFKIKKPGLYSGNLAKLGIKNVSKIKISKATYSDCLSYCKSNKYEPHLFGSCEDQCSFICNQTGKCLSITGKFRIATLGGHAMISFTKSNTVIDSETFNNLPDLIYLNHTFFLPFNESDSSKKTIISWDTSEMSGDINIGETKAIKLIQYGDICGSSYSECSIFGESKDVYSGKFDKDHEQVDISADNCKQILLDVKSNCTFPVYVNEEEKGQTTNVYRFDENGSYQISCPRVSDKITLSTNIKNCYISYNSTVFHGIIKHESVGCYNNSITTNGQSYYACICNESGINKCGSGGNS